MALAAARERRRRIAGPSAAMTDRAAQLADESLSGGLVLHHEAPQFRLRLKGTEVQQQPISVVLRQSSVVLRANLLLAGEGV